MAGLLFLYPVFFPHVEGQLTYNLDNVMGVHDVAVRKNTAYATCNRGDSHTGLSNQLAVIDITNPTIPYVITFRDYTGFAYALTVVENYAYLACNDSGLAVIDVVDPTTSGVTAYRGLTGNALGVAVSGSYAYVACDDSGLAVINVSNPLTPGAPVYCGLSGRAQGVAISGSFAYVACSDKNLAIINVSNPMSPGTPVYRSVLDVAYDVAVANNYAYLACGPAGLAIINVTNPASPGVPLYRNSSSPEFDARFVTFTESGIYLGAEDLYIVDIADPANPGGLSSPGCVSGACGSRVAIGETRFLCGTHLFVVCSGRVTVCNLGGYFFSREVPIVFGCIAAAIAGTALMVGKERPAKDKSVAETEEETTGDLRVA